MFALPPTDGLAEELPDARDERDELMSLLAIYDLWLAPIERFQSVWWQHHPDVAALKWELEKRLEDRLDDAIQGDPLQDEADAVAAIRSIAARDRVPPAYEWLARAAGWDQLVHFLAVEGGPDGGFDDMVALCQVGVAGPAKVVLADNYWDEMGRGHVDDVHTVLHDRLVDALDMPRIERADLPIEALQRAAVNGLLATNRRLQPEMVGALGLLELQAGPRCRKVLQGLDRLDAPPAAIPFYKVHADIDPRHGKEWLDGAIAPLAATDRRLAQAMVRGACWRSAVNAALFDQLHRICSAHAEAA
jgi:hypothetical protein